MDKQAATTRKKQVTVETRAFSIAQFCQAYGISRATFYNLKKANNAPATIQVGRRPLITTAAAETWEAAMTASSQAVVA